jgi:hypothetical protein
MESRKPGQQIKYKYMLNENYKQKDDSICVSGIYLTKGIWNTFDKSLNKEFFPYIKTHINPKGFITEYIHDPLKEVKPADIGKISFKHKKKIYSRDHLVTLTRSELEDIAKEYFINPKEKINTFLIKCIIDEQKKYRDSLKTTQDFFDEANKIEK